MVKTGGFKRPTGWSPRRNVYERNSADPNEVNDSYVICRFAEIGAISCMPLRINLKSFEVFRILPATHEMRECRFY